jgi:hypothetical protein
VRLIACPGANVCVSTHTRHLRHWVLFLVSRYLETPAVRASYKATDGHLFMLEESFFYLTKPAMFVRESLVVWCSFTVCCDKYICLCSTLFAFSCFPCLPCAHYRITHSRPLCRYCLVAAVLGHDEVESVQFVRVSPSAKSFDLLLKLRPAPTSLQFSSISRYVCTRTLFAFCITVARLCCADGPQLFGWV